MFAFTKEILNGKPYLNVQCAVHYNVPYFDMHAHDIQERRSPFDTAVALQIIQIVQYGIQFQGTDLSNYSENEISRHKSEFQIAADETRLLSEDEIKFAISEQCSSAEHKTYCCSNSLKPKKYKTLKMIILQLFADFQSFMLLCYRVHLCSLVF